MTLTELLISSILVGIIIIGAISADFSIRTWQKRIEERALAQQDLTIAMEKITSDIKQTAGNNVTISAIPNSPPYPGIFVQKSSGPNLGCLGLRQPDSEGVVTYSIYCSNTWFFEQYITKQITQIIGGIPQDVDGPDNIFLHTGDKDFCTLNPDTGPPYESLTIKLETRATPREPADPVKNPTFTLETTIPIPDTVLQ